MEFDTWLNDDDLERLWMVCHGQLPDTAATDAELVEFERCVMHAAMKKFGGDNYLNQTVH